MSASQILKNPKSFWALWGASAVAWQASSLKLHNGATGSETTRALWRVETPTGKKAFLAFFYTISVAFLLWFPGHIVNKAIEGSSNFLSELSNTEDNDNGN